MPATKNASYRYRLIDSCLRRKQKRWKFDELLEYISQKMYEEFDHENGVSKRTLEYDFQVMKKDPPQGYGAPIVRKDGYVFYTDPDFSINENPLNEVDIENLNEILKLLKSFESLPQYKMISDVVGKIRGEVIAAKEKDQSIQLESNLEVQGLKFVEPIYQAIRNFEKLSIEYQPFTAEEPYDVQMHPYVIKEYNNRWFLIGWAEKNDRITNLALDRIKDINTYGEHFEPKMKQKLLKDLEHVIGPSISGSEIKSIQFKVDKSLDRYFITKPLHPSQKVIEENDKSTTFQVDVIPNIELEAELLRFGEAIEILQPTDLRSKMKERIHKLLERYTR